MKRHIFVFLMSLFVLAGCSGPMMDGASYDAIQSGLTKSSYAAADMLIQQSRNALTTETPLETGILTEVNNPGTYTAFGRLITNQIGARFVQLGYNVSTASYQGMAGGAPSSQPMPLQGQDYSPMSAKVPAKGIISGNYAVGRKEVYVSLNLIEVDTGRILAAYNYNLPLTSDVKELMDAKPDGKKSGLF